MLGVHLVVQIFKETKEKFILCESMLFAIEPPNAFNDETEFKATHVGVITIDKKMGH
jgi:hypothetical protein